MLVNTLQHISKKKKTWIAVFADFYVGNTPPWLVSAFQHKSLSMVWERDEQYMLLCSSSTILEGMGINNLKSTNNNKMQSND